MHSTNPPWCAAFSAMQPSMRWSRCDATSSENFGDLSPDELAEKFRLAWSV